MWQTQGYHDTKFQTKIHITINSLAKELQYQLVCRNTIKLAFNNMANNNKLMTVILMRSQSITSSSINNVTSQK